MKDNFGEFADNYNKTLNDAIQFSGEEAEFFIETKIKLMNEEIHRNNLCVRSILDFGCGTGNALKYIHKYFPEASYYGIDVSKQSIQQARTQGSTDLFFYYEGNRLPFENNSFDIVFASVVFHHISLISHTPLIEDIHRVLNPNGGFFLFEHNPYNPFVRKIVKDCPFDKDAFLLSPKYSKKIFHHSPFQTWTLKYYLFFPKFLKIFRFLEKYLSWALIGAQYYIFAKKRKLRSERKDNGKKD
ncbi:MAG: class I SAM-dependent methyltransferase [Desulfobacteraceae bacterium]|jgi:SAM-dependent methyltransferase|nr:class I SAM-dependent methyltransferase [Desulfobacteraceae bacterium]